MPKIRLKKQSKKIDYNLLILVFALTVVGLIAVTDASAPIALKNFSDKFHFAKQQLIWGIIGLAAMIVVSKIHYSFWKKIATPLFYISIVGLILVLIPSISSKVLGARRWIIIGSYTFQPSELVKLTIAIYLAKVGLSDKKVLAYLVPLVLAGGLIMLQPDLGTAIIIGVIGITQIFISGVNIFILLGILISSFGLGLLLILISDYRKARLLTFLQQTQDPLGKGYHIRQILYALGTGGLFGIGLGQSRQKFLFLPEAATDSIFAVVAEEVGFIGATIIILLFVIFIYRCLKIALNAPDKFSKILASGIIAWIGGQAFLNIASMVALTPLTGIPLPFFSYGGSSLTTVLIATGILLNISRYVTKQK